jgi:hypothetical protein
MTPAVILEELERLDRRRAHLIAQLRSAIGVNGAAAAEPSARHWISTGEAAQATNLSQCRIAQLCRENELLANSSAGFARRCGGRWQIWPARFYHHIRQRPARA